MIGVVLLIAVSILIFLGLADRVLDRLYLSDRGALLVVAAMVGGSFFDIPLGRGVSINVGGGLVPLALAVYVLSKAGSGKEWLRSILGIAITTGVLYGVNKIYRFDADRGILEPQYLWAIIAGIIAYIAGRSRRLSFIVATLGVLFMDIIHFLEVRAGNLHVPTRIGGAGVFDTLVIAGVLAVLLAELIGESREAMQGGPAQHGRPEELAEALDHPQTKEGREQE
ncbi:MAG TPA: DUF1614 domain-containing protein [Bacillota bacterium]